MHRRRFLAGMGVATLSMGLPFTSRADVPDPYSWDMAPPLTGRDAFVAWMRTKRGEDPGFLQQRWDRYEALLAHHDLWGEWNKRSFLLVPREEFVTPGNRAKAYEWHYLDIGYGVTITGPHTVGRMTCSLGLSLGAKVLEIGTGSGYQSAILANITPHVHTIEIIPGLATRTRRLYDSLIARGYTEYQSIATRNADGYYGWEAYAPFDAIIVTCGIDHVPPPLMQQLKPGGTMIIPVGSPGAQHVLKISKNSDEAEGVRISRSDIYGGSIIPFVPFTRASGN